MTFRLVDPRGTTSGAERSPLAPRPGAIPDNLVIGFLINEVSRQTGPDFTGYTHVVEDELRVRHHDLRVVRDAKPVLSRPADRAMLEKYRDCRGVVTGLAK
jgi:hypothetical protein